MAATWLSLGLIVAAGPWATLPSPAAAQSSAAAPSSAIELANVLAENLPVGSVVVVRPLTAGHTGLPDSVARRVETLIENALGRIPRNMRVDAVNRGNVEKIYNSLDESSFDGGSEKLLESVLRAARANTVLACEPSGGDQKRLEVHCSMTYAKLTCPGGGEIKSCKETVRVEGIRNLASTAVSLPWRSPDEYLEHVFTGLAWKLAGPARLDDSEPIEFAGEVEGECPGEGSRLGRFVTGKLRRELVRAARQRVGWRPVEGEKRDFRLEWSVVEWDDRRYWLTADLYRKGAGAEGSTFVAGESAYVEISSLPGKMRIEPCKKPDPDPNPLGGRAILVVKTEPPGAVVRVGGVPVGETPLRRTDLQSGTWTVELDHPTHETVRLEGVELADGQDRRIEHDLASNMGIPGGPTPPPPPCGTDEAAAGIFLPEGITLADWVLMAGDRLEAGAYVELLVEAKRHLRDHCRWEPLVAVLEGAVSGLVAELAASIESDPRAGLGRLAPVEAAAGRRPELLLLRARAHELLGEHASEEAAYLEWIKSVPQTHPDRRSILAALGRVRSHRKLVEAEVSLGLTVEDRTWIRWGLGEPTGDAVSAGREFDDETRSLIRSWQEKRGAGPTGYLTTREEKAALVAAGREAERKRAKLDELAGLVRAALQEEDADEARGYLEKLKELDSGLPEVGRLEAAVVRLEKKPGKRFQDCDGCPWMVVVPAGSYEMGSPSGEAGRRDDEGPVQRVTISQPFAVGVYEVTFREWDACRRGGGCSQNPGDRGWGRGDRPVIYVSWDDAKAYVRWLSRETGEEYRLLSESEWEYVARAGTRGPFHFGSMISPKQANYNGNYTYGSGRKGRYRGRTVPVGSFPANRFGLHDVHGNVGEWVEDCWHGGYQGAPLDGRAWTSGGDCGRRVLRGGSWLNRPGGVRSAARFRNVTGFRFNDFGFRVARTLD